MLINRSSTLCVLVTALKPSNMTTKEMADVSRSISQAKLTFIAGIVMASLGTLSMLVSGPRNQKIFYFSVFAVLVGITALTLAVKKLYEIAVYLVTERSVRRIEQV